MRIKLESSFVNINLDKLFYMNSDDIHEEIYNETSMLGYIGEIKVKKIAELSYLDQLRIEKRSELYLYYKSLGRKYSEKHLESLIEYNLAYKDIKREIIKATKEKDILQMAYDIVLKFKKDMIIQASSNKKIDKKLAINFENRIRALEANIMEVK